MKRLLLPFLAALALPTAVNAEVIYLSCSGEALKKDNLLPISQWQLMRVQEHQLLMEVQSKGTLKHTEKPIGKS